MQRHKRFLIASIFLLLVLACNIGAPKPLPTPTAMVADQNIATKVEQTLRASGVLVATEVFTQTPSVTPPPTLTFTPVYTPTPTIPRVSVSVDTSCRSGPGRVYAYLGALLVGEEAQVVAKNSATNYWVINNPDASGECWLWGEYATIISGNTDVLPEYAIPITPTPAIPVAPSNFTLTSKTCDATMNITLTWTDNSLNEEGFSLYKDNEQTHIIGFDRTSVTLSVPYINAQPIQFALAAFNKTGESAKQTIQVVCP